MRKKMATRKEFTHFMAALAKAVPMNAPKIDDDTIALWFSVLGQFSFENLQVALKRAMMTCEYFPSVKLLLSFLGASEADDDEVGREVGERIWTAISKWGCQPKRWPEIAGFIGPVGASVVEMQGGWVHVCETATNDNAAILKAQWRELAIVQVKKIKRGDLGPPKLPDGPPMPAVAQLAERFKP